MDEVGTHPFAFQGVLPGPRGLGAGAPKRSCLLVDAISRAMKDDMTGISATYM